MLDDLDTQLQTAFHFTDADLQTNRDGHLTPEQQQHLKDNMFPYWKIVGMTVAVVLIGTVLAIPGVAFSGDIFIGIETLPAAFAIIVVFAIVFLLGVFWFRRKVYAEIRAGRVVALEGRLKIVEAEIEGSIGRFQVRKHTFNDLSEAQFDVMCRLNEAHNRPKIIVYHVPNHYKLLSVEVGAKATDTQSS